MAKDLILFNPDRDQMTIKQLSSCLRDVEHIDHTTNCMSTLKYFKNGGTHLAVVTQVERQDQSRDPYLKKVGIVTLEDIIEELIADEIVDEYEEDNKEAQRLQKEQLLALFMQRQAGKVLAENEIKAVTEFLANYVTPFFPNRIKTSVLQELVINAEVIEIESDSRPFTHKTDEQALIKAEGNF